MLVWIGFFSRDHGARTILGQGMTSGLARCTRTKFLVGTATLNTPKMIETVQCLRRLELFHHYFAKSGSWGLPPHDPQPISTVRQPPLHYLTRSVRRTSGFVLTRNPEVGSRCKCNSATTMSSATPKRWAYYHHRPCQPSHLVRMP